MINSGDSPERRKRRWTPWRVFFLAFTLLVVLAVLLVTFAGVRFSMLAGARIEAQLTAMREAGEPATPEELEEHYRLPPDVEDTTALWMEAVAPLDKPAFAADAEGLPIVGRPDAEIPPPGEPWEDLEAVEKLLAKYRASLELMHQAAEAGGAARYPVGFHQGMDMPMFHSFELREGARLLSLEAHVRAHRGDPAGAARSIRAILTLARSLKREPTLLSLLVRIAVESIAIWQIEDLLGTVDFSEKDLIAFQEQLRAANYEENLHLIMLGERVMVIMAIEDPTTATIDWPPPAFWRLTRQDGLALSLEHFAQLVPATQKPWPQPLLESDQAEQRLEQITGASIVNRIRYNMPGVFLPTLAVPFEATARIRATNGAADAAIAIERYQRRYGKLPEKLDELVPEFLPEVPVDAYDGQPLRYLVDDEGCRICSLGRNRTDEGGVGDLAGEPDIVFRTGLSGSEGEE
jgi:hypothetical protein